MKNNEKLFSEQEISDDIKTIMGHNTNNFHSFAKNMISDYYHTKIWGSIFEEKMKFMKSLNSLTPFIKEKGIQVDKIGDIKPKCIEENKKNKPSTLKALGYIPFLSKIDPWMEYMGQIQSEE